MLQRKSTCVFFILIFFGFFIPEVKAQPPYPEIELCFPTVTAKKGDTICVPVTVKNYIDVEGFGMQILYNANIVRPLSPLRFPDSRITEEIKNLTAFIEDTRGSIKISHVDLQPITLPDDIILFEICFVVIGSPGDVSPVFINEAYSDHGFIQETISGGSNFNPFKIKRGSITVVADQITISTSICDATNAPTYNNGILEFMIGGGTPPYSYTVTPGGPFTGTNIIAGQRIRLENLPPALYTIMVTDATGATQSVNARVSDNFPYFYQMIATDPTCANREIQNGSVQVSITNPGPFNPTACRYEWSNFVFNTNNNTQLSSGTYYVTIIDPSGCRAYDSASIFREPIVATLDITQEVSCPGGSDGEVIFTSISGGFPFSGNRYQLRLNGSIVGFVNTITGIDAGINNIEITDSLNCSALFQINMPAKDGILIDTLYRDDVSCFGLDDGRISIQANEDGNTNFIFVLRRNNQIIPGGTSSPNTFTFDFLEAGSYNLTITSVGTGCRLIVPFVISQPNPIDLSNVNILNPSCGTQNGVITVSPAFGTAPYNYVWSHNAAINANSISGLSAGNYTVTVTDQNGCTATNMFSLTEMSGNETVPLINTFVSKPVSCFGGNDGSVTVICVPPSPTYTYQWFRLNETNVLSTFDSATNLSSGTYVVIVRSGNCSVLDTIDLMDPQGMNVNFNLVSPTCPDSKNGSIGATVTGGNPNYTYQWFQVGNPNIIALNVTVLTPIDSGEYLLILTDSKLCTQEFPVYLAAPDSINLQLLEVNQVNCFGQSNGRAEVIATGGTSANPVFNYFWSTSPLDSGPSAFNLPAGRNWVIAADNVCASDTFFFDVPTVPRLSITSDSEFNNPSCFGSTDGYINLIPAGGVDSGFVFNWTSPPAPNTPSVNNLGAGTYYFRLSDFTGCTISDSVTLTQPDSMAVTLNSLATQLLSCRNLDNGQIGVFTTGGNPGIINYTWNNNIATGAIISGLSAGNYCVTATDSKGCNATFCYELVSPPPVTGRVSSPQDPGCFGEKTELCIESISGGTGNKYTFQVNQGQRYPADSCILVFAGTYTINLIDSAGCFIDTTITINQPDEIEIDLIDEIEIQLGLSSDLVVLDIPAGISVNSVTWLPADTTVKCQNFDCTEVIFNPVSNTTYQVIVTDADGCTAVQEILVRVKDVRNVFFPNIFAPREIGDRGGSNNYFNVSVGAGVVQVLSLEVYDRWGNKLFEKLNYLPDNTFADGWDGTFGGNLLDSGVYVYKTVIRFSDGKDLIYTGDITLTR
jgi:hypothetical protein